MTQGARYEAATASGNRNWALWNWRSCREASRQQSRCYVLHGVWAVKAVVQTPTLLKLSRNVYIATTTLTPCRPFQFKSDFSCSRCAAFESPLTTVWLAFHKGFCGMQGQLRLQHENSSRRRIPNRPYQHLSESPRRLPAHPRFLQTFKTSVAPSTLALPHTPHSEVH